MAKRFQWVLLALVVGTAPVHAERAADYGGYPAQANSGDVIMDVMFGRPLGLVGTIVGTALFLGLTPFTALASIPQPHDAFPRVAGILIGKPVYYTFRRPLGVLCLGRADYDGRACDW